MHHILGVEKIASLLMGNYKVINRLKTEKAQKRKELIPWERFFPKSNEHT